jgi:hypothetical protein
VIYANNRLTDVRHLMHTLDEDNIYNGIVQMVHLTLFENRDQALDSSPLSKAGVKIMLPDPYSGSSKLKDFKIFITSMLRWLKLNCMLGTASQDWQLTVMGTHLTGEAQEWYMHNVESLTRTIQAWNLETAVLGLQHRFLLTLMHRHAAMDFDAVHQGNGTVQELYNLMIKLAEQMVHPPDEYTV